MLAKVWVAEILYVQHPCIMGAENAEAIRIQTLSFNPSKTLSHIVGIVERSRQQAL